jgi:hypothetical protein
VGWWGIRGLIISFQREFGGYDSGGHLLVCIGAIATACLGDMSDMAGEPATLSAR